MNLEKRVVPRGIPTVTYARILNPLNGRGGDVLGDGNSVTILDASQASTRHDAAQVFNVGVSDQQFCESTIGQDAGATMGAHLNPIAAFVDDSATTIMFMIGSKNSRKSQFLKKSFLPFLANELFACIGDKAQQLSGEHYQSSVTLTSFEILDEVITDLLRPSTRGLGISVTAEEGVTVHGLFRQPVSSETQLRSLLTETCDNRASHTLPVGGSIDSSTAVWELSLHQVEGGEGRGVVQSHGKLVIVDVPCVNPLVLGSSDLRQLEGPTLHKSLLSFADVIGKLSSPIKAAYAPFRSSKLTHFVSELLGGNAIVIASALLHPGEPEVSRKSMELLEKLGSARHYPIASREMTDLVQGLLIKFRAMVIQLQDELNHGGAVASTDAQQETKEAVQVKIAALQQSVAESNLKEQLAKDDCLKLFEMLELMKEKYATVMEQNAKQAEELICSEEDKLSMARALVEIKLLYNDLQEDTEKEKYDSSSSMLANKNEIFELDEAVQKLKSQLRDTDEKLRIAEFSLEQEKEVGISTRASLVEVRTQLEGETEKNIELSAELLTLVNQKNVLSSQLAEVRASEDNLKKSNHALADEASRLREDNSDLKSNFVTAQDELVRVRQNAMLAEMEVKRAILEKEQAKLEYERGANEILRDAEQHRRSRSPDSGAVPRVPIAPPAPTSAMGEDLANLASYKWQLQRAESKLEEMRIEHDALLIRLKDATEGSDRREASLRNDSEDVINRKMAEMQQTFSQRLEKELQQHQEIAHRRQETATTVLKQHISILETENKKMREVVLRGRIDSTSPIRGRPSSGGGGGGGKDETGKRSQNYEAMQTIAYEDDLEAERGKNKQLTQRLRDLEKDARQLILGEVNETETRNAALTARNALLEEELKQYRAYMKDTVGKYKHQIHALRAQMVDLSASSSGGGAARGGSTGPSRREQHMNVSNSVPELYAGDVLTRGPYDQFNSSSVLSAAGGHISSNNNSSTSFPQISRSSHRQVREGKSIETSSSAML